VDANAGAATLSASTAVTQAGNSTAANSN